MKDDAWLYDPRFWEQFAQHCPMGAHEKELIAALAKKKRVPQARIKKRLKLYLRSFGAEIHAGSPAIN